MKTFTNSSFSMYTEIIFGKDAEMQTPEMIKKYSGTKVMFLYGSGSIKKNGLYERIVAALDEGGLPFVEFGGIKANPLRSVVEKGIEKAKAEGVDFFLAVGGGSVIDTAKAIAVALANGGEYWPFYLGVGAPESMLPVGAINTIAAAGSETSSSTVLVDDVDTGLKKGLMHAPCRPCFAILNPELTYSTTPYQTASGAADAYSHTYMRYLNPDSCKLGDEYAAATLRTVVRYASVAIASPEDYEARSELMLCSAFGHNGLTGIGRILGKGGGEHGLEQQLSGHYDTPHGAGLAVMMPAMLKYIMRHGTEAQVARVAQLGVDVFGVAPDFEDVTATASEGIERFMNWLKTIGMPVTLSGLGLPKDEIPQMVERCIRDNGSVIHGFIDIDEDGMLEIFNEVR